MQTTIQYRDTEARDCWSRCRRQHYNDEIWTLCNSCTERCKAVQTYQHSRTDNRKTGNNKQVSLLTNSLKCSVIDLYDNHDGAKIGFGGLEIPDVLTVFSLISKVGMCIISTHDNKVFDILWIPWIYKLFWSQLYHLLTKHATSSNKVIFWLNTKITLLGKFFTCVFHLLGIASTFLLQWYSSTSIGDDVI